MKLDLLLIFSASIFVCKGEVSSYPNKKDFLSVVFLEDVENYLTRGVYDYPWEDCYNEVEKKSKNLTDEFIQFTETAAKQVKKKFYLPQNPNYRYLVSAPLVDLLNVERHLKDYQESLRKRLNLKSHEHVKTAIAKKEIESHYDSFIKNMKFFDSKKHSEEKKIKSLIINIVNDYMKKMKIIADSTASCFNKI